jgi:hypothetical protein
VDPVSFDPRAVDPTPVGRLVRADAANNVLIGQRARIALGRGNTQDTINATSTATISGFGGGFIAIPGLTWTTHLLPGDQVVLSWGAMMRNGSYPSFSGNPKAFIRYTPPGGSLTTLADICAITNVTNVFNFASATRVFTATIRGDHAFAVWCSCAGGSGETQAAGLDWLSGVKLPR